MITNQFIIEYLKDYYKSNNKPPIAKNKQHPFSCKTVYNKFKGWNNALKLAGIPLNINKSEEINCNECNKLFIKTYNQIKKTNDIFVIDHVLQFFIIK
jgi:hypothetical protein